ncbi:MAG: type II secretion system protein GspJ [Candidatus Binatia bacterium]
MSRRRAAAPGFTLLEVVLAMTSLALVAGICYGAFHLGLRAVQKGEVAVVVSQRLRVASDVLIRQIKSAVPYPARNRDEDVYPFFMGTATSMTFVTTAGLQQGTGLTRVMYRLAEDPPRLVLEESGGFTNDSLGRDSLDRPGDRSTVLLDGFRALRFEYIGNDGGDVEEAKRWDGREREMLPAAVRIVVDGMPGLETEAWGQEIPLMVTTVGEEMGSVDDEDLPAVAEEGEDSGDESGRSDPEGEGE